MPIDMKSIQTAIATATIEELNAIISACHTRGRQIAHKAAKSFCVGDIVRFEHKTKGRQQGEVIKINTKTVIVLVGKTKWTCAPTLLHHVGAKAFSCLST